MTPADYAGLPEEEKLDLVRGHLEFVGQRDVLGHLLTDHRLAGIGQPGSMKPEDWAAHHRKLHEDINVPPMVALPIPKS